MYWLAASARDAVDGRGSVASGSDASRELGQR